MSSSSNCRVKVAVRIRPYINKCDGADPSVGVEVTNHAAAMLKVLRTDLSANTREKQFEFDHVIDGGQDQLYEAIGKPLLQESLNGYNTTCFSFGATSSGKTFSNFGSSYLNLYQQQHQQGLPLPTMNEGNNANNYTTSSSFSNTSTSSLDQSDGLFPRLVDDLFTQLQQRIDEDSNLSVKVSMSAVEVYNEKVRDLLAPRPLPGTLAAKNFEPENLDIVEDNNNNQKVNNNRKSSGAKVKNLGIHNVLNAERVKDLLTMAMSNRQTSETKMNEASSRSHLLIQLTVTQISDGNSSSSSTSTSTTTSKDLESTITIVDLAGSERQTKSGTSGQTLEEGKMINLSLLTLGRALHSLSSSSLPGNRDVVVSLRDSKLTRLLGESLGGNSKTWMLATIAASACHLQETLSTLDYATHARAIANKNVHVNTSVSREEIQGLRDQLSRLEQVSHCMKLQTKEIENEETRKESTRLLQAVSDLDSLAIVLKSRLQSAKIQEIDQNIANNVIRKSLKQTSSLSGKTIKFSGAITRKRVSEISIDGLDYITVNMNLDDGTKALFSPKVFYDGGDTPSLATSVEVTIQRVTATQYSLHIQDIQMSIAEKLLHHEQQQQNSSCSSSFVKKFKKIRGKVWLFQDEECFYPMKSLSVDAANLELSNNSPTASTSRLFPLSEEVGSSFARVIELPFLQSHHGQQFVSEFIRVSLELDCL